MVCAGFPLEVIADDGHDELCSLHDGGSVVLGVDGAGGDDVALLDCLFPGLGSAVDAVAVEHFDELAGGA